MLWGLRDMTVRKIHKNVCMEGFPGVSVVKNPSANARHTGLNPGPGGASGKKKKKKILLPTQET